MARESWSQYFTKQAELVSTRSTCLHRQYGAVLVRDHHAISSGFNGAPRGCQHCLEIGCARAGYKSGEHPELCRATHAEQNAVALAAKYGISVDGTELYIYPGDLPCPLCAKILINAGIAIVHYSTTNYPGWELSRELFMQAGVILHEKEKVWNSNSITYSDGGVNEKETNTLENLV